MYKRRIKVFLAVILLALAGLAAKLWQLQITHGQEYRKQFEQGAEDIELLGSTRGRILDRNGEVLAEDKACYDFCLDYRFIASSTRWTELVDQVVREAGDQSPQQEVEVRRLRAVGARWAAQQVEAIRKTENLSAEEARNSYRQREGATLRLAEQIAASKGVDLDAQVGRIIRRVERIRLSVGGPVRDERMLHAIVAGLDESERQPDGIGDDQTIGASFVPSLKRFYPRREIACHIVGLTGPVDRADQGILNLTGQQADRLTRMLTNYLDGDVIGKTGVEKMCEKELRGQRGYRRTSRDNAVTGYEPASPGDDVRLTIDIGLQEELTQLMWGRGVQGSAVVLSIPDGQILAMVSVPAYDPNKYRQDYEILKSNPEYPLLHRAITRRYPPGSTAKVVTAMAGIASGLSPQTTYVCEGLFYHGHPEFGFKCDVYPRGHGSMTMLDGIKKSCNVYFYNVGRYVGSGRLANWFRLCGYGSEPGTGLPEEVKGSVPRMSARIGDPMMWAIGQGKLDGTPLQVANSMACAARGEFLSPRIVVDGGPEQVRRALPIRPDQLSVVQQGLWKVVNEPGGTGYKVFREGATAGEKLPPTCGKTGTAECPPQRLAGHPEVIIHEGNMAWFAGYTSYTRPQIAFAVVVEYVKEHGAVAAGPIARELVKMCQRRGYVQ
ncbi:MAG: penicillin-binding transpeptidase domain-containing protein [Phycisphaerae bacterium]